MLQSQEQHRKDYISIYTPFHFVK